jgi:hypothetical protein
VLTIPLAPARLRLPVERLWNGAPCDLPIRAAVELALAGEWLEVRAELRQPGAPRLPDARPGTRVAGLWEYDVVELFLAGAGGRYLEIELGAGGHFLVLSFRARRVLADAHEALLPRVRWGGAPDGARWSALRLPRALLPAGLRAGNAFAIAGGRFLAWRPVPGAAPDFHQPSRWPTLRLAGASPSAPAASST